MFYDWQKTNSYQKADIYFIVGDRGIGKTYGLRKQCILDFQKDGSRFVEICRYASELGDVGSGYFSKMEEKGDFPEGWTWKYETNTLKIMRDGSDEWEVIGYLVALTGQQKAKKRTFANVRRIIFDEVVLDRNDQYHNYLKNEYLQLANLVSTILREEVGKPTKGKLYLLGNACDLLCPYFEALGIDRLPKYGYNQYKNKSVLFHYTEPQNVKERIENTFVGRMLAGTSEQDVVFSNKFKENTNDYVAKKSSTSTYYFGVAYNGITFGIWKDFSAGMIYVNKKVPKNAESSVWSLTTKDNAIDFNMARKTEPHLKLLLELFYLDGIRYDTPKTREQFFEMLRFFGIR